MRKAISYKVPFTSSGDLINYPEHYFATDITWINNLVFADELTIRDYSRGRSAANFTLVNSEGQSFTMFLTDFIDVIKRCTITNGRFSGTFTFVKRGQNYGVRLT